MKRLFRVVKPVSGAAVSVLIAASPVVAGHNRDVHTANFRLKHTETVTWPPTADQTWVGDLAFEGRHAVAAVSGSDDHQSITRGQNDAPTGGFASLRLAEGGQRVWQLSRFVCKSYQEVAAWGDVILQGNVATSTGAVEACDRSGMRVIDASNPRRPRQALFLDIPCGVGEFAVMPSRGRVYAYVPSTCRPQAETPMGAGLFGELSVLRVFPNRPKATRQVSHQSIMPKEGCYEIALHAPAGLGACVGGPEFVLLDVKEDPVNPELLTPVPIVVPGARYLTTAAFTWDGQYLLLGESNRSDEPAGDPADSLYLYNVEDPTQPVLTATWSPPTSNGLDTNVNSISFVPMRDGRDVAVVAHGNSGLWLVDFSEPSRPMSVGHYWFYSDDEFAGQKVGGWVAAAHWYNGYIYATDGLNVRVLRVRGLTKRTAHFFRDRYNPETVMRHFR